MGRYHTTWEGADSATASFAGVGVAATKAVKRVAAERMVESFMFVVDRVNMLSGFRLQ